jgi:WhiB family redox-sensing transcriptional regulator
MNDIAIFVRTLPRFPMAECAKNDIDPDMFFPDNKQQTAEVIHALRKICGQCVHRKECFTYAIREGINHGVWAGSLPEERAFLAGLTDRKPDLNHLANQIERLENRGLMQHQIASAMGFSELEIAAIKSLAGRKEASSTEKSSSIVFSPSLPSVR